MADILIRDLGDETIALLKARADRRGRSLQSDLQELLEWAASVERGDGIRAADEIRTRTAGRVHSDSAELIREDRER